MQKINKTETHQGDYFIAANGQSLTYCYNTMPVPQNNYFKEKAENTEYLETFLGDRPASQEKLCGEPFDFEAALDQYNPDGVKFLEALFGLENYDEAAIAAALGTDTVILHKTNGY